MSHLSVNVKTILIRNRTIKRNIKLEKKLKVGLSLEAKKMHVQI